MPAATVAEVRRLVLLTAGHAVDAGRPRRRAALRRRPGVLAAPPEAYDGYAAAIRRGVRARARAGLPGRPGRGCSTGLLALPALFRLPPLAARWESPARANLTRELAALR